MGLVAINLYNYNHNNKFTFKFELKRPATIYILNVYLLYKHETNWRKKEWINSWIYLPRKSQFRTQCVTINWLIHTQHMNSNIDWIQFTGLKAVVHYIEIVVLLLLCFYCCYFYCCWRWCARLLLLLLFVGCFIERGKMSALCDDSYWTALENYFRYLQKR